MSVAFIVGGGVVLYSLADIDHAEACAGSDLWRCASSTARNDDRNRSP